MTDHLEYNQKLIQDFRANRESGGQAFKGRPLLLLTTTGAKSGEPRISPMMYVKDGDRLLVMASNIGARKHPAWYHNLVANPDVTVEVGDKTFAATAVVTEGAERQRLWNMILESYPFFGEHQAKTTREIPVVALERKT
jgi:deazaflavin-dependent oxidoreductase (nitroreductase family)